MREMIISRSVISPALILVEILITLSSAEVKAVPSFACQTGMPWSACHVQAFGPLLKSIGRNFKLSGYIDDLKHSAQHRHMPVSYY
jgi:hypothetical protein